MFELLADESGVLLRRDAVAAGFDDRSLLHARKRGELVRLRQGVYALPSAVEAADDVQRHRMLTNGVMRLYGDDVAQSHVTACVGYGAPTWGLDLGSVHLTSLFGRGERNAASVRHHRGACRIDDLRLDAHRRWITTPARTALDTASLADREAAICLVGWFLHEGLVTRDALTRTLHSMTNWPDTLSLLRVLQLAHGAPESVGEHRTLLMCRDQRLELPECQYEVRDAVGHLVGRVDFAWPARRLMLEFDGRGKSLHHRRPGESIEDAVLREKRREDRLREITGWALIRIVWADLAQPERTVARIRAAMARSAA